MSLRFNHSLQTSPSFVYPVYLPRITSQRDTTQKVAEGEDLSLAVTAEGHPPLKYQWARDEKKLEDNYDYAGSSTDCLLLRQVHIKLAGKYCCTVSNRVGEEASVLTTVSIGGCVL